MTNEVYPIFSNSVIVKNILKQIIEILKDEDLADRIRYITVERAPNIQIVRMDMIFNDVGGIINEDEVKSIEFD